MIRVVAMTGLALIMAIAAVGIALGGGNGGANTAGSTVLRLTVKSEALDKRMPLRVVVPPGGGERPLVLFLHGRGQTPDGLLTNAFFAALADLGRRAPAVAFPDGDDSSYWHDRASGAYGRYVFRDALPAAIDAAGADGNRVAIGGISMGGFGALDVARAHPGRFCAVGGHSPALWTSANQTAPGAFDDAADFGRHDVVNQPGTLADAKVWLDAGRRDPFIPGMRALADRLGDATVHTWAGGHDGGYWARHWDEYLRFYARQLRRCG